MMMSLRANGAEKIDPDYGRLRAFRRFLTELYMGFKITIHPSGNEFSARDNETILNAALEAGYNLPYGCRNGFCGACKGKVVQGTFDYGDAQEDALSQADREEGKALFCCAQPSSDLVIECQDVGIGGIQARILPCRVERKIQMGPDVLLIHLKLPSNERLQFLPGQYLEFILKDGSRRAFSLANAPHDDQTLELHLRLIPGGKFTEYVFNELPEKAIMRFEGPFGQFTLQEKSDKPIVFVAGGTGFAPIKGIIEHAFHHQIKRNMVLYWGANAKHHLYLQQLPEQWAAEHSNFRFIPVLSAPVPEDIWTGRTGLVTEAVLEDIEDFSDHQVYCCGAPAMVEVANKDFVSRGLPEDEFFSDAFTFAPRQ